MLLNVVIIKNYLTLFKIKYLHMLEKIIFEMVSLSLSKPKLNI